MKVQKIQKNDEKRPFRRSKVKVQKIQKNDEKRRFRRSKVKVLKIRKNDEKRRFRRSKVNVQKVKKNDEKRLSGSGEVQNKKIRKNDEKRRFRRSKVKVQKIRFLLNALKKKKIKEIMMRCDSVEKFCFFIDALAHSPILLFRIQTTSQLSIEFFFCDRRLSPLAHLGQFSYFSYDRKMMRNSFQESIQMIVP